MPKLAIAIMMTFLTSAAWAADYQSLNRCGKFQKIWVDGIKPSEYQKLPALSGSFADLISALQSSTELNSTFDRRTDFFPKARKKIIHAFGTVVGLRYEAATPAKLSGLLGQHHECVLGRFSVAGDPGIAGFVPGLALKFFVDGQPSRNIMVMHSLDGQGQNQNFFAQTFSNILPKPNSFLLRLGERWFATVKKNPRQLTVDHLLAVDKFGQTVKSEVPAPLRLILKPKVSLSPDARVDFRLKFKDIPPGTVLYEIYAQTPNSQPLLIGRLRTITVFVNSSFADSQLFFQHQR